MSQEQLTALLARVNEDASFKQALMAAGSPEAAIDLARQAGFDVCNEDWLAYQARSVSPLGDEELESVAGGVPGGCTQAETYTAW